MNIASAEEQEKNDAPLIWYFEDDCQTAELIRHYVGSIGYQVIHFSEFDQNMMADLQEKGLSVPELVLIDINLPGLDGYQVCEMLKQEVLGPSVPFIFVSGLMERDDILKAYEVGACDYLTKPIKLSELSAKIEKCINSGKEISDLKGQLDAARNMAFQAMTTSSELGSILQFHELCMGVSDKETLARHLLEFCETFSLSCSVLFTGGKTLYFPVSGVKNELERQALELLRAESRIFCWGKRVVFNYQNLSLLVKNMPIEDQVRFGELKDLLCLVLNGVQARLKSMETEGKEEEQRERINSAAANLGQLVVNMEERKVDLSSLFNRVISNMENKVAGDILQFSLLEREEHIIMNHIQSALREATDIFDCSSQHEQQYKLQLTELLQELR
ncbi:response regulator [Pseudomaricurvus alkylphenolicus]|uniref:response regulator n=1 Tax=Pseudomaricurvus alkylphenolicus TaxID=1306991 RepID=UPI0014236656|nr:response regulator [Pseudomaricurvus alkylphenolicus]NIB43454.1 response regulator [Pseudomaricurvus alkylphenolicus]